MQARSCPHLPRFTDKQSWCGLALGISFPHNIPNGDLLTLIAACRTMTTQQQEVKKVENQHRKIAGYRELSQEEIDLMNRIKAKGAELLDLQAELQSMLHKQKTLKALDADTDVGSVEFERFCDAEPLRWAGIGKTDIQTGIMALVRAVAQPAGV
jgi:uncharacterized protein YPO0396